MCWSSQRLPKKMRFQQRSAWSARVMICRLPLSGTHRSSPRTSRVPKLGLRPGRGPPREPPHPELQDARLAVQRRPSLRLQLWGSLLPPPQASHGLLPGQSDLAGTLLWLCSLCKSPLHHLSAQSQDSELGCSLCCLATSRHPVCMGCSPSVPELGWELRRQS